MALSDNLNTAYFCLKQIADISCFLGSLIYLEVIELRFCGLNKNTRKSIIERAKTEALEKNLNDKEDSVSDLNENEEEDENILKVELKDD